MKNLYPKGSKGRIHPSPTSSSASAVASYDCVLRLLPAFILALTVGLTDHDKEVLAYLVNMSKKLFDSDDGRKSSGTASTSAAATSSHQPKFDCNCFDCYTNFWSRWDASPNREIIHQAIEAYEEHLGTSERRRDSRRRSGGEKQDKSKKSKGKKALAAAAEEAPPSPAVASLATVQLSPEVAASAVEADRRLDDISNDEDVFSGEQQPQEPAVLAGERRRWPDVIGIISRWSLWGPGV